MHFVFKRHLAFLLALLFSLSVLPSFALAASSPLEVQPIGRQGKTDSHFDVSNQEDSPDFESYESEHYTLFATENDFQILPELTNDLDCLFERLFYMNGLPQSVGIFLYPDLQSLQQSIGWKENQHLSEYFASRDPINVYALSPAASCPGETKDSLTEQLLYNYALSLAYWDESAKPPAYLAHGFAQHGSDLPEYREQAEILIQQDLQNGAVPNISELDSIPESNPAMKAYGLACAEFLAATFYNGAYSGVVWTGMPADADADELNEMWLTYLRRIYVDHVMPEFKIDGDGKKMTAEYVAMQHSAPYKTYITITDAAGNMLDAKEIAGTGMTLNVHGDNIILESKRLIITGDGTGSGCTILTDLVKAARVLSGGEADYITARSLDINGDDRISINDLVDLAQRMGQSDKEILGCTYAFYGTPDNTSLPQPEPSPTVSPLPDAPAPEPSPSSSATPQPTASPSAPNPSEPVQEPSAISTAHAWLYGESHSDEQILKEELRLWGEKYAENGFRHLFIELPYYTAEFLNLWMREDDDTILDAVFKDTEGTAGNSPASYAFYQTIKRQYPETIFHGTDVGHQYGSTGQRYLNYLTKNGAENSENYFLAQECIKQGELYYLVPDGDQTYREQMMAQNFSRAFDAVQTDVMGFYGDAHISDSWVESGSYDPGVPIMAIQLADRYNDKIHRTSLVGMPEPEKVSIAGKEYDAEYYGKSSLTEYFPELDYREFWHVKDAYKDFASAPRVGNTLPSSNYIMPIQQREMYIVKYTRLDGSTYTEYHIADGTYWEGMVTTQEISIPGA